MQQYKCARVSALTGSPAQWHAKWPRGCSQPLLYSNPCRQSYYISRSPLSQQLVSISLSKEYFTLCISRPWTDFCVQYCCSRIDQIEYQGQTRNTRILESKPLIDTYYCIRHRLELKYFHFAQFLLNPHRAAHGQVVVLDLVFAQDSIRNMRLCHFFYPESNERSKDWAK